MGLIAFLSDADALRTQRTLDKLRRHNIAPWVLTGGFAIELHRVRAGLATRRRPLNDMDFLADSFDDIPKTLAADFVFRHVHPQDPPGKALLQSVDPETAVRVDVFRAYGNTIARAIAVEIDGGSLRMISVEDLTARIARLSMDLGCDTPMPAKHSRDFLRLLPLVETDAMESVWQEHRKPSDPESFAEVSRLLIDLIATRKDLQIIPSYSHDPDERCSRCEATEAFPLADAGHILSLLGYC
jgi:hypothetical protein